MSALTVLQSMTGGPSEAIRTALQSATSGITGATQQALGEMCGAPHALDELREHLAEIERIEKEIDHDRRN